MANVRSAGSATPTTSGLDPGALGWLEWNMPPQSAGSNTAALTTGTVYGLKIPWRFTSQAVTTVGFNVGVVGATLSGSQVGLYDMSGTRLGTASADAAFLATNWQTVALSIAASAMPVGPTYVYLALLAVGTTGPQMLRAPNATGSQLAMGATGNQMPFCILGNLSAQANLPTPITLSSNATSANAMFAAIK